MNFKKIAILGILANIIIATSSLGIMAAPAASKSALNVRSGPGVNYRVIDSLYKGERVKVGECVSNGWCYITQKGPNGWVSAKYLRPISVPRKPRYIIPSKPRQTPPISFGFTISSNGNFTFGLGVAERPYNPYHPHRLPRPPSVQKVCFYKGANFTGAKYCVNTGVSDNMLPSNWNNKISSIKLSGGANVQICRNRNFRGGCWNINSSKRYLYPRFDNAITSFQAY